MDLTYKNEKPLYAIILIISLLFWVLITAATLGTILFYLLIGFIFYLFVQSGFISYMKGNGVKVSEKQYPDLYAQYKRCCEKLQMDREPDIYILNSNGVLNALATIFLRRYYVVLYSSVIDALRKYPDGINFYIGHELGHIKRGHLSWQTLIFPAQILPLLGAAYSRAREYTCDLHGNHCCDQPKDALFAMGVLATGPEYWSKLNIREFISQSDEAGGFWMSFHELTGDYPWLCKRMNNLYQKSHGASTKMPARNIFAWLLALFVPRTGLGGGGLVSLMIVVAVVGILAAVALPAYQDYTVRAKLAPAYSLGSELSAAVKPYVEENAELPYNLQVVGIAGEVSNVVVKRVEITDDGIVLHLTGAPAFSGDTLIYTPYYDDAGVVQWTCTRGTLPVKYLPPSCK